MNWVIGILTFLLVVDCLFLILLILIQLPKKEAGLGQAFGGSTTDALFGAGSGTVLTKLTRYAASVFLAITFLLSILNSAQARQKAVDPRQALKGEPEAAAPAATTPAAAPAATTAAKPATGPTSAVPMLLTTTASNLVNKATNAAAKPTTNTAAPAAK
jgi:preprotein translocase subunit SecG